MPITTDTAIGGIADVLLEEISYARDELSPSIDGFASKVHTTSHGVTKGLGRDLIVKRAYCVGVAGSLKHLGAQGPVQAPAASTGQAQAWITPAASGARSFPKIGHQAKPGYLQVGIQLMQTLGIFSVPINIMMADEMDASITDVFQKLVKAFTRNYLQSEAASIYTAGGTVKGAFSHVILSSASPAPIIDDPASTNDIILDFASTGLSGRVSRFIEGKPVQFVDPTTPPGTVIAPTSVHIVKKIDYHLKRVYVGAYNPDTGAAINLAAAAYNITGVYVTDYGTVIGTEAAFGPSGIESYVKTLTTDSIFSNPAVALSAYPQLRSLGAAINGVLDGNVLNRYIGGFYDALGDMCELDSLIGTTGILNSYLDNIDGLYRYERNNQKLRIKEGWSSFDYSYGAKNWEYLASRWQQSGQLYVLKLADQNWKRFVPPIAADTSHMEGAPSDVRFIGKFFGSANGFMPGLDVDANLTEFASMPMMFVREYAPDQVQGIILTGLDELNP